MHMLEIISLLQADELIQAVTASFLSGVGCRFFPGPPDARLLLQNSSPPPAQWKEMFMHLHFHESLQFCFLRKARKPSERSASCFFLSVYCKSLRSFVN